MSRTRDPRLVSRFALSSLVAFVAVGAVLAVAVSRELRQRYEELANFHAAFVVNSILRYELRPEDLDAPLPVDGARYKEILRFVHARILDPPVVRIKVLREDGTILFSDEPRLVGMSLERDEDVKEAFAGELLSEISDLTEEENIYERSLAAKLFESYVPLYIGSGGKESADAVVELYQDYAGIQDQIDRLFTTIAISLLIGLSALYVLLLPISRRVARRLSDQNRQLEEQAEQLQEAIDKEQHTVSELRELNRLKDEFVAVASHEVRTPLTSIIGYAKTLQRPEFSDDAAAREEFLQAIERQGGRLSRLVENLLTTSQMEYDQTRLSLSTVSFASVVRDVLAGLGPKAERVRLDLPAQLPLMSTDRQRLELVVMNLLDNALKFSPDRTRCELGARQQDGSVVFWVRDWGIGIPADQVERIFERFYQVDSTITRRFGGVGLGLSLVKELSASLGGTVVVTSEVGGGSTFTVTLPARPPSQDEDEGPMDAPKGSATAAV
jgi:signal transduction histidine kinase